jgi:diguanylate cyclase (GGDEF)-like protein
MRVLIAEDDPVSRRLLEASLAKWGYEAVSCVDGAQTWAALQRNDAPRLAILDWMMPGLDGPQICRKVRGLPREDYTYLILLTSRARKEDLVAGMDAGADDYVTKPFDPHELRVRLRAGQRIIDLQAQLVAAREALRAQATHDPLTGLWNRGAILDILERELARTRREPTPLTVLMADVDHFKAINDTHGHAAGDAVLRDIAGRMTSALRPYDSIGRFGGEEFLLVLPGCTPADAAALAERIRSRVAEAPIGLPEGAVSVTLSLGLAITSDDTPLTREALIRASDRALYEAKEAGRNRIAVAR